MIRYLAYLLPFIAMRLVTFPLAPIAVLFQSGYKLPFPFHWMDTDDFDLRGDGGHKDRCFPQPTDTYCCMVKWMLRNGGHHASYWAFGMPFGQDWFWSVKDTPGLQWRLGWNPKDEKYGRCKYNLTVRYRRAP